MLQLADKVELMLRETILTFEETRRRGASQEVAALEDEVDADAGGRSSSTSRS